MIHYAVISLDNNAASPAVFLKNSQLSDINPMQDEPIPENTYLVGFTCKTSLVFSIDSANGFGKVLWTVPESSLLPEHKESALIFDHAHTFKVWMVEMLMKL